MDREAIDDRSRGRGPTGATSTAPRRDASRESLLATAMVELADTLVDDFDVVDLLTTLSERCVEVLDIAAAGIMLASPAGDLRAVSSSSEALRIVELFELQVDEGPCRDCFRTGRAVVDQDLAAAGDRWPSFAPVAVAAGFRAADAVPLRVRGTVIGALNLFRAEPTSLGADDVAIAQALADIATVAILQHRALERSEALNDELTAALHSRIVVEQAKGMIAEHLRIDVDRALVVLRRHARDHDERLVDAASSITSGTRSPSELVGPRPSG